MWHKRRDGSWASLEMFTADATEWVSVPVTSDTYRFVWEEDAERIGPTADDVAVAMESQEEQTADAR